MNHIILQPMGNAAAIKHYNNTIESPVPIESIDKFIDPILHAKIKDLYPDGKVLIWGVKNGVNDVNKHKWDKVTPGDVTLFSKEKIIFKTAVTTLKFKNAALANDLWGVDSTGETWENIYLIDELKSVDLTYKQFNEIVGYDENNVIQGFNVLDDYKSSLLFNTLNLYSEITTEDIPEIEFKKEIDRLMEEDDLDKEYHGTSRKEQAYLRRHLFNGRKAAICGICGKEFPVDLLIAAHIKMRAECSKEERLDVDNIVVPMCKMGCDDLYEKGYILVVDGYIKKNARKWVSDSVKDYIEIIENTKCSAWNENSKKYFEEHNKKFK